MDTLRERSTKLHSVKEKPTIVPTSNSTASFQSLPKAWLHSTECKHVGQFNALLLLILYESGFDLYSGTGGRYGGVYHRSPYKLSSAMAYLYSSLPWIPAVFGQASLPIPDSYLNRSFLNCVRPLYLSDKGLLLVVRSTA